MSNIVLKNAWILTMDENLTEYKNGYIEITDDTITSIGDCENLDLSKYKNTETDIIDCGNKIIIPGMINTHNHLPMIVFRSLADDVADRLKRYLFPLEKMAMNKEMAAAGAEYAFAELLMSGVTCVYDAYYFEDEIAQIADKCKIRAVLSETILNFESPNAAAPYSGIEYSRQFIGKWKNHKLVSPAVNCHAIYTNDTEHLRECHKLARENDIIMCMHVAEMDYEQRDCLKEHGMTPVEYLDSIGVLDEKFLAAHSINLTDNDLSIYKKHGVKVAYNAGSNSKGAKGVARVNEMNNMGIVVSLGTDGAMSGNTIDIITQLSLVGKIQKVSNHDRTLFPAREILKLATINGAKALGLDKITGSLEVGKKADIAIFETDSVNMNPIYDPYSVIVYSSNPSNVESTIVNGEFLMRNRKLLSIDINNAKNNLFMFKDKIQSIADELDRKYISQT